MAAYTVSLHQICGRSSCDRRATVAVYNTYNAPMGQFCAKHGAERVKDLNRPTEATP